MTSRGPIANFLQQRHKKSEWICEPDECLFDVAIAAG
jgi:hypothetical protein